MSSDQWDEIRRLLDETERNIKRVEVFTDAFVVPMLNEWRYATRHVVNAHFTGDADELRSAIEHLRRARYDSFDVLLAAQIQRIHDHRSRFVKYVDIVEKYIPGYADWQVKTRKAMSFFDFEYGDFDKEEMYDGIRRACAEMGEYIEILEATQGDWQVAIRKEKRRELWSFILGAVAVLGSAATIAGLFMR